MIEQSWVALLPPFHLPSSPTIYQQHWSVIIIVPNWRDHQLETTNKPLYYYQPFIRLIYTTHQNTNFTEIHCIFLSLLQCILHTHTHKYMIWSPGIHTYITLQCRNKHIISSLVPSLPCAICAIIMMLTCTCVYVPTSNFSFIISHSILSSMVRFYQEKWQHNILHWNFVEKEIFSY